MENPAHPTLEDMGLIHPTGEDEVALDHNAHMDNTSIDDNWKPAGLLESPPSRDGFVQRWILIGYGDEAISNIRRRMNEGWKPRNIETMPAQSIAPLIQEGRFPKSIIVQDMCLMEMPVRKNDQRTAHYAKRTDEITRAIDQDLGKASQAGGRPIYKEAESQVSVGSGQRPQVAPD